MFSILIRGLIGGLLSRWHGGGVVEGGPKMLKSFLWSAPFAYCAFDVLNFLFPGYVVIHVLISLLVLGLSMAAMNTGHGLWYSLATVWKYIKPERLDFIVAAVFGADPRTLLPKDTPETRRGRIYDRLYFRCIAGLVLKGTLKVVPCAAIIALASVNAALILCVCGALMAFTYALGHEIYDSQDGSSEFGEIAGGVIAFIGLGIAHALAVY